MVGATAAMPTRALHTRIEAIWRSPAKSRAVADGIVSSNALLKALHLADTKHECADANDHLQERKAVAERITHKSIPAYRPVSEL
jgi:hypothetical protein